MLHQSNAIRDTNMLLFFLHRAPFLIIQNVQVEVVESMRSVPVDLQSSHAQLQKQQWLVNKAEPCFTQSDQKINCNPAPAFRSRRLSKASADFSPCNRSVFSAVSISNHLRKSTSMQPKIKPSKSRTVISKH